MKSSTVGIILENTRTLFIWIETIIASVIAVKKKILIQSLHVTGKFMEII